MKSRKKFRLPNDFRERVLLVFSDTGLTQVAFAKITGVSAAQFSELKSGKTDPSMELIFGIANHIRDYNVRWLLTGKGQMKTSPQVGDGDVHFKALVGRLRRVWDSGDEYAIGKMMEVIGFWANRLEETEEVMPRKLGA